MSEPVARLLIELEDISPRIWRRVDVPTGITLTTLHEVIQAVMRWEYAHLYEFRAGERVYGDPFPGMESPLQRVYKASGIRLNQLIDRHVTNFLYVYDFGDDWRHRITVEDVRDGDPDTDYPVFVEGARRAPPEDVGGLPGFEEFLKAMGNRRHPQHAELTEWAGGGFDPEDIGPREIELDLAMLAEFRRRVRAGHKSRAKNKT
ncbi:MAG: plasmid pRiA4b ORF-3 family protein [Rhodobacteraceae bacterium]|nr:plasmid pRiA4b ORF-3 family protein [Paracoccaceae bacterium]MCC6009210.1 plasmid pRiA4b ORF-3 family protein [Paracoccaceae bacterium]